MRMNNLSNLNGYLFEALDRLSAPGLDGDELKTEVERAKAVSAVADKVIDTANIAVEVYRIKQEVRGAAAELPKMLESGE